MHLYKLKQHTVLYFTNLCTYLRIYVEHISTCAHWRRDSWGWRNEMNKIQEILNKKWTKTILTYVKSVLWIKVQDLSILCTQIIKKN